MAKSTNADELAEPLFSFKYDLSAQMVDEAAHLIAGDKLRNPAGVASIGMLVLIVIAAISPITRDMTPLLVVMVIVEVALWTVSDHWPQICLRRLRNAGLNTALIPADERRRTIRVYEDTLTISTPSNTDTLSISSLRDAKMGAELAVLTYANNTYVLVPRRSMSAQRYHDMLKHLGAIKEATSK